MNARVTYKLCHRWMRKLLAAGQPIPTVPPTYAGLPWFAAREALKSRNAKTGGAA